MSQDNDISMLELPKDQTDPVTRLQVNPVVPGESNVIGKRSAEEQAHTPPAIPGQVLVDVRNHIKNGSGLAQ